MSNDVDILHTEMEKSVLSFVSNSDNNNKILLINQKQGSGKTVTTAKTLLENKIKFTMLFDSHKSVKDK